MADHHGHHPEPETAPALRTKAIASLLVEKGLISSDAIDFIVQQFEQHIGPMTGAKVVPRVGTDVAEDVAVPVGDSTAEVGSMIFPERPEGTDGFTPEQLAELVTRDSMVGVVDVKSPAMAR